MKMNECQHITLAIRNAGESANIKVITLNKLSAKLKVSALKPRTTHSRKR
jgi:hypothetical protein